MPLEIEFSFSGIEISRIFQTNASEQCPSSGKNKGFHFNCGGKKRHRLKMVNNGQLLVVSFSVFGFGVGFAFEFDLPHRRINSFLRCFHFRECIHHNVPLLLWSSLFVV